MTSCRVILLDEAEIDVTITEHSTGNDVFSNVCKYLNLIETDYFGIIRKTSDREHNWINLEKSLHKQIVKEERANLIFHFAVKFYPTDPTFLREEITKYLLCLQIRDDLTSARLPCPLDTLALLSSYWLQSEMGDYDVESDEVEECLRSLRGAKGQSMPEFDGKVLDLYKSRREMPPSDADTQFLRLASQLPLYGVHRYQAEEESALSIGVGSVGLVEIGEKESTFHKWIQIKNINYKKNKFYLKLLPKIAGGRSILKKYHMRSSSVAKAMWSVAVDHHVFYRVTASDTTSSGPSTSSSPASGPKLSKKRKRSFRLSFRKKRPRTESDVQHESSKIKRLGPRVVRQSSLRRSASLNSNSSKGSISETNPKSTESTELKSILKQGNVGYATRLKLPTKEKETRSSDVVPTSLLLTQTIDEVDEADSPITPADMQLAGFAEGASDVTDSGDVMSGDGVSDVVNADDAGDVMSGGSDGDVTGADVINFDQADDVFDASNSPNSSNLEVGPEETAFCNDVVGTDVTEEHSDVSNDHDVTEDHDVREKHHVTKPTETIGQASNTMYPEFSDESSKSGENGSDLIPEKKNTDFPEIHIQPETVVTSVMTSFTTKVETRSEVISTTFPVFLSPPLVKKVTREAMAVHSNVEEHVDDLGDAENHGSDSSVEGNMKTPTNSENEEFFTAREDMSEDNTHQGADIRKKLDDLTDQQTPAVRIVISEFNASGSDNSEPEEVPPFYTDVVLQSYEDLFPHREEKVIDAPQNPVEIPKMTSAPVIPVIIVEDDTESHDTESSEKVQFEQTTVATKPCRPSWETPTNDTIRGIEDFCSSQSLEYVLLKESDASSLFSAAAENEDRRSDSKGPDASDEDLTKKGETTIDESEVREEEFSSETLESQIENGRLDPKIPDPRSDESLRGGESEDDQLITIDRKPTTIDEPAEGRKPSEKQVNKINIPVLTQGSVSSDDVTEEPMTSPRSEGAVLGDDDVTIGDLVDDFRIVDDFVDNDNEDSFSSLSDITDNTDELCNPNILEIILSKSRLFRDTGEKYSTLFGVPVRKNRGRARISRVKSDIFEPDARRNVSTQVPSPPIMEETSGKRFVPSWPFNAECLAQKIELDENERAMVKKDLQNESRAVETNGVLKIASGNLSSQTDEFKETHAVLDSLPGIPDFARSVELFHLHDSRENSVSAAPDSPPPLSSVEPVAKRFPPAVFKFSADENNEVLAYTANEVSLPTQNVFGRGQFIDVTEEDFGSNTPTTTSSDEVPSSSSASRGSTSSFPKFIQSVFKYTKSGKKRRFRKRKKLPKGKQTESDVVYDKTSSTCENTATEKSENNKQDDAKNSVLQPPESLRPTLSESKTPPFRFPTLLSDPCVPAIQSQDSDTASTIECEVMMSDSASIDEIVLSEADEAHFT